MAMKRSSALFFTFLCCFTAAAIAEEALVTVHQLLQKASKALQEKNYKGRFTYEFGSVLETLEIIHAVKDGVEYERIQHLNGREREFVRSGREEDCVTLGHFLLRGGLVSSHSGAVSLAQNYHFYIRGEDRIAGREAAVIQAVPKDEYRFGMTMALDKESGLPLMSLISASSNKALERFQFVQLDVLQNVDVSEFNPELRRHRVFDGKQTHCAKNTPANSNWRAAWLPAGFLLTETSHDEESGEMLTFTDGLSAFSVFIMPATDVQSVKKGLARRGATLALMAALPLQNQTFSVALVGEVPVLTARRVVESLRPSF